MVNNHTTLPVISNKTLVLAMLLATACHYLLPLLHVPSPTITAPHVDFVGHSDSAVMKQKDEKPGKTASSSYSPIATLKLPPFPPELDYDVFDTSQVIPRLFISRMPALDEHDTQRRKQQFIQVMLPLILKANDEILDDKQAIALALRSGNGDVLAAFAKKYRLPETQESAEQRDRSLQIRVQPIPVDIALAQAAVESGWGQSRFTREGNALFGQWVWDISEGIKPAQASNSRAAVRSFPDLLSSVRSYMTNLNTHYAYEAFRKRRSELLLAGETSVSGLQLIPFLSRYAETGSEYVATLEKMITQNDFDRLASRQLSGEG